MSAFDRGVPKFTITIKHSPTCFTSRGIKFVNLEPIFWKSYVEKNNISTSEFGFYYPFRRAIHKINVWWKIKKYTKAGKKPQMCEMCGEDIAVTHMYDPNNPTKNKMLYVCESCPTWVKDCIKDDMEQVMEKFR